MTVPSIETERLLLRAHGLADYSAAFAMWTDPEVTRFIGGKPSTAQQVWMRIINYAGFWSLLGFGYWAIEEKATGAFAGEIGFADFHRDIDASMRDVPEIGWALRTEVKGRGYATEAVRAVVSWGDKHLREARTVCLISPANLASIRVAEKGGYRRFKEAAFLGEPIQLFERMRA